MTLSTGGFRQVVAFPPAPIATGWSDPCREGLAPSQEPCLSTAHDFTTTTPEFKFSAHTSTHIGGFYRPSDPVRYELSSPSHSDPPPSHRAEELCGRIGRALPVRLPQAL